MAAQRGMEVVVLRPKGYALPDAIMQKAHAAAAASGGVVTETSDRNAALEGAHVVYAKEWGSPAHYGDAEAESRARQPLGDWCVRENWFKRARPDCHFMHCLPVRRNVAVADEVLDGPRSRVIREAANRMVVQMAVLYRLLRG
jgi:N-acetylornithine carbamoyltransferase